VSRWRALADCLLPVALLLQFAAARAPGVVEAVYARGAYPVIAELLGRASGSVPAPVGELLVIPLLLAWSGLAVWNWRAARREQGRALATLGALSAGVGGPWLVFLACWGFNYQRLPFAVSVGLDTRPASLAELKDVCEDLAVASNRLREGLPEDAHGVLRLSDGPAHALGRVAAGFEGIARLYPFLTISPGRPKRLLSSTLFSYLGITGIYLPFTAEASVNLSVPDVELPFSASHETAHRLGVAREEEANYVGYLACRLHPDREFRYAGTLAASSYALAALARVNRRAYLDIAARRTPAVRRDLEALAGWSRRYRSRAAAVSSAVNDAFLRAQGQREGVRSYGRMVDLLIAERRTGSSPRPDSGRRLTDPPRAAEPR